MSEDRESLGRMVYGVLAEIARERGAKEPLRPWGDLSEANREVDRRIGQALYACGYVIGNRHGFDQGEECRRKAHEENARLEAETQRLRDREKELVGETWRDEEVRVALVDERDRLLAEREAQGTENARLWGLLEQCGSVFVGARGDWELRIHKASAGRFFVERTLINDPNPFDETQEVLRDDGQWRDRFELPVLHCHDSFRAALTALDAALEREGRDV